ncbi:hypothetical protein GOV13_01585 [Candidatus Pacearchaeota archaeon]|nr:hypothetical protein [Candidatus Pacearchaeota archaeon]
MPTVIKLIANSRSQEAIRDYLEREGVPNRRKEFYSTLWYSLTPICKQKEMLKKMGGCLPLEISPPYSFDIFSTSLVLKYSNETRTLLRHGIRREGVRQSIKGWDDLKEGRGEMIEKSLVVIKEYDPKLDIAKVRLVDSKEEQRIYFTSKPHITLAKNFDSKGLEKLSGFEETLVFDDFSWKLKC